MYIGDALSVPFIVSWFIIIRENQRGYREFGGLIGNYPSFTTRLKMDGLAKMCIIKWKCINKTALIHKQESKFERLQGSFSCLG